jgi:hypothetical protein
VVKIPNYPWARHAADAGGGAAAVIPEDFCSDNPLTAGRISKLFYVVDEFYFVGSSSSNTI